MESSLRDSGGGRREETSLLMRNFIIIFRPGAASPTSPLSFPSLLSGILKKDFFLDESGD